MAKKNSATYNGYSVQDVNDKASDVARSTVSTLQAGLAKTQDLLSASYEVAQEQLKRGKKQTEKSVKKAQKNLKLVQDSVQDSVQSGFGVAQDVLGKGTKTAGESLVKVTENVKDMQGSIQNRLERYQRRRARAKTLFRMGLVSGLALTLLFTPWPGSEIRRQLGEFFQQLAQQTQDVRRRF